MTTPATRPTPDQDGLHTATITVAVAAADFATGWASDPSEFAASVQATLFELQGDDGGAYLPAVTVDPRLLLVETAGGEWVAVSFASLDAARRWEDAHDTAVLARGCIRLVSAEEALRLAQPEAAR